MCIIKVCWDFLRCCCLAVSEVKQSDLGTARYVNISKYAGMCHWIYFRRKFHTSLQSHYTCGAVLGFIISRIKMLHWDQSGIFVTCARINLNFAHWLKCTRCRNDRYRNMTSAHTFKASCQRIIGCSAGCMQLQSAARVVRRKYLRTKCRPARSTQFARSFKTIGNHYKSSKNCGYKLNTQDVENKVVNYFRIKIL